MRDAIGALIRDFTYDDKLPWPVSADGSGHSLVLRCPNANPDHKLAANWLPSALIGGTPGTEDGVSFAIWLTAHGVTGQATDDDDLDQLSNLLEYGFGTDPLDPASVGPIASLVTDSGGDYLALTVTRGLTATDILFYPEVSEDLVNWSSDPLDIVLFSSLNNGDGTVTEVYRSTIPSASFTRKFMRMVVEMK